MKVVYAIIFFSCLNSCSTLYPKSGLRNKDIVKLEILSDPVKSVGGWGGSGGSGGSSGSGGSGGGGDPMGSSGNCGSMGSREWSGDHGESGYIHSYEQATRR